MSKKLQTILYLFYNTPERQVGCSRDYCKLLNQTFGSTRRIRKISVANWQYSKYAQSQIIQSEYFSFCGLARYRSMAATIYASGAFHEDGLTDSCDAFGGGWTKEQILSIMKDSRIGAYGTVQCHSVKNNLLILSKYCAGRGLQPRP